MRIRKRPSLQSLCSPFASSDPPKPAEAEAAAAGRDPPDPLLLLKEEDTSDSQITINHKSAAAAAKKPALMEGSRCSRVNGRGWRCCQQTLVGYSLCEHHLGKGRLRSMSGGIRSRSKKKSDVSVAEKEEKMGTMKAKSISSLLDETDHAAAAIISSLSTGASK